jgi:hypothetical protein
MRRRACVTPGNALDDAREQAELARAASSGLTTLSERQSIG